jgi:predicted alpha/beta-fold hydrolase
MRTQATGATTKTGFVKSTYAPPWWLPGGNLQTVYPRVLAPAYAVAYERQRWETPDGDFIDLDWVNRSGAAPKLLVLFHGLEGGSLSHYALGLMTKAQQMGWRGVVPHFRGCGGEINRLTVPIIREIAAKSTGSCTDSTAKIQAAKSTRLEYRSVAICFSNGWANRAPQRPKLSIAQWRSRLR